MANETKFSNVQVGAPAPGAADSDVGKYLDRNGVQVLGDQVEAIADATGTGDDAVINAILAALRDHGIIAT